jgi:hypothetical protein
MILRVINLTKSNVVEVEQTGEELHAVCGIACECLEHKLIEQTIERKPLPKQTQVLNSEETGGEGGG